MHASVCVCVCISVCVCVCVPRTAMLDCIADVSEVYHSRRGMRFAVVTPVVPLDVICVRWVF